MALRRGMHLRKFEDAYTAPQAGFASAADFYARASSAALIPSISIPTRMLASRDDPLVDARASDLLGASLPADHPVRLLVTRAGGHLGFIARGRHNTYRYWMDDVVADWVRTSHPD